MVLGFLKKSFFKKSFSQQTEVLFTSEQAAHMEGAENAQGLQRGVQGVHTLWFLVSSKQVFLESHLD